MSKQIYSNLPFGDYREEVYSEMDSDTFEQLDVSGFRHSGTEIQVSALLYSLDFHPRMAAHILMLFYVEMRRKEQEDEE